ncbi:28S ribosomal protein S5, mitochondrial [Didymella heteroderae]|uniref:Small ribosomal subunit protein uS5m n=1 Tax=Didymella heteroderae TaxID=1769908 RepID=A0A9P4WUP6_9PLEO|nr:28S ribosomal protein S5, mitochondrial [Didymella heteroderae]
MSVCRPARCLFAKATATATALPKATPQRSFHSSAPRAARRRRPHYASIKAEDLKQLSELAEKEYPRYDTSEVSLLEKQYTPAQIAAIKAAEATIDPKDVYMQGSTRDDAWRLPYADDLAEVDPVTDHPEKLDASAIPGKFYFREANEVERDANMARVASETLAKLYPDGVPEGQRDPAQQQQLEDAMEAAITQAALDPRSSYTGKNQAAIDSLADPRHSILAQDLPRLENRMARQTRRLSTDEEEDPREKQLLQYMGWTKSQLKKIRTKTLVAHGVVNQTRMGKIRSMYYLTIAGNQDGLLGVGEGKSVEPEEGRKQSIMSAIRNMKPVPRYENRTTFGDLERKVGATKVQLFARPPGFGLRTQHLIFELARAAGLQDLAARTPRSRNKMNVIKATWEALTEQRLPDEIARARGKKLVDVRKVYYGGSVH